MRKADLTSWHRRLLQILSNGPREVAELKSQVLGVTKGKGRRFFRARKQLQKYVDDLRDAGLVAISSKIVQRTRWVSYTMLVASLTFDGWVIAMELVNELD